MLTTGFVCSIITARLLGPEANGTIAFALWLSLTGALIAELGTGVTLLRILPQLRLQGYDEVARRGFASRLARPIVISTVVLLTLYSIVYWEPGDDHWASLAPITLFITGILFFVQSIGSATQNYLIGEQRLGSFFRLTIIASIFQLAIVLAGALAFGIAGALVGYVAGQVVLFVYTMRILATPRNACGIGIRYLVGSSLLLSAEFIVDSIFLNRLELLFLEHFHGMEVVSYYAVALSLANLALQLPIQLTGSLLPYYSEHLETNRTDKLPIAVFSGVVRSIAYLTLPMSFGLAAISESISVTIYGEAFRPSGNIVALLAFTAPVFVLSRICTLYFYSLGRIRDRLIIATVCSTIMVLGCLALVPSLGGEGAALARFIVFLIMCLIMFAKMKVEGSMKPMFAALAKVMLAAAACGLAAGFVADSWPGAAGLVSAILCGAIVYLVFLRLLKAVPLTDIEVLSKFSARLPALLAAPTSLLLSLMRP
jgi:O-antigen/teichoic acid export membrane protein